MQNVYIVGPSCGGKTSLIRVLKQLTGNRFNYPIRVVSREPRGADDMLENIFMSKEDFVNARSKSNDNKLFLSWHKRFGENRKEYYGFRKEDVIFDKINIFSGNNALLLYPDSKKPEDTFSRYPSRFIACTASEKTRMERLKARSPEYNDEEVRVRIYEESIESFLPDIDLVIDSEKESINESTKNVLQFLNALSHSI